MNERYVSTQILSLGKGKNIIGFADSEEKSNMKKATPFLVESTLIEPGANYSKTSDWQEHVVADEILVTGQILHLPML